MSPNARPDLVVRDLVQMSSLLGGGESISMGSPNNMFALAEFWRERVTGPLREPLRVRREGLRCWEGGRLEAKDVSPGQQSLLTGFHDLLASVVITARVVRLHSSQRFTLRSAIAGLAGRCRV